MPINQVLHVSCPVCGWKGVTKETIAPKFRFDAPQCPECFFNAILTRVDNGKPDVNDD